MTFPWTPGKFICDITSPPSNYPPHFDVPAQPDPYVVSVFWGGRSKSDSGARGGATSFFRNLNDPSAVDTIIAYAPVQKEFPDNPNKKEDWIVTGSVINFRIPAGVSWRATCLYQVSNDHMVNAFLRVRFDSGIRRVEDEMQQPWYPPPAGPTDSGGGKSRSDRT